MKTEETTMPARLLRTYFLPMVLSPSRKTGTLNTMMSRPTGSREK